MHRSDIVVTPKVFERHLVKEFRSTKFVNKDEWETLWVYALVYCAHMFIVPICIILSLKFNVVVPH